VSAERERQWRGHDGAAPPDKTAQPDKTVSLDQAFDADSLYALRAAVAAHAAAAGLDRYRVYDVTAVAHELAANAVVHGAGHGRLRLWAADGFLYCQVSDDGEARAAGGLDGETPWPVQHGHGLWLVGEISEQVGIGRGPAGTTATVRFPFDPGGPAAGTVA
jgi:anti-sigma regulatory factor (Ser/Thr protein kinase)